MNASVAIQVLPDTRDENELIRIVDEVIAYIKSTGLNFSVGPFETTIEGDYDQLMDIVKECQKVAVNAGAKSVSAYVKVVYKPEGDVLTIEKKIINKKEYVVITGTDEINTTSPYSQMSVGVSISDDYGYTAAAECIIGCYD